MDEIHENGFWLDYSTEHHAYDPILSNALAKFFKKENASVIDVGCGEGLYINNFLKSGINCKGFDGNPNTPKFSGGICGIMDFTKRVHANFVFDWVLSLEVGEHIPSKHENTFLLNLNDLALKGIIVSWAIPGQNGRGHVNCRTNQYIVQKFADLGWAIENELQLFFRMNSSLPYFKNTIMVYSRASTIS